MNPTQNQKLKLNNWASCTRFLYNKTISHLLDSYFNNKNIYNIKDRLVVVKNNNFYNNKEWLKDCPSSIKKSAVFEAQSNLKAAYSNLKARNIKKFKNPYRTKKHEKLNGWSYSLDRLNIQKNDDKLYIFKTILGEMKYFSTKQLHKLLPDKHPEMDCKIQKDKYGDYYLLIPYKVFRKEVSNEVINPVSLDPGVRKFITSYSLNESFIFGNRWNVYIMDKLLTLDKLYSKLYKKKHIKRRKKIKFKIKLNLKKIKMVKNKFKKKKLGKKIIKLRKKIDNLKIEIRNQVANFLSKRYDCILMPKLDVKNLSIKKHRQLRTKTVRMLLNARHSEFFKHLKDKCFEHGTKFLHVREEYTSQTCPCCGWLNKCNELYKCKNCNFVHDRDVIGALNIMLKAVR